jgi:hypothetical protein
VLVGIKSAQAVIPIAGYARGDTPGFRVIEV